MQKDKQVFDLIHQEVADSGRCVTDSWFLGMEN